jgi:hypothetical protein
MLIFNTIDISALLKAQKALGIALAAPENDLNREESIKGFTDTIEKARNTEKTIQKFKGYISTLEAL